VSLGQTLMQSGQADVVGELHLDGRRFVIQLRDRPIEITFEHTKQRVRRQPHSRSARRGSRKSPGIWVLVALSPEPS